MHKISKVCLLLSCTCLMTACGTNDINNTDVSVIADDSKVLTEVQSTEESETEQSEVNLPKYMYPEDSYGFQIVQERLDDSSSCVLSKVLNNDGACYSVYSNYTDSVTGDMYYNNTSMLFSGDKCYLEKASGVVGYGEYIRDAYEVIDAVQYQSDFEAFSFHSNLADILDNAAGYIDEGASTIESESGVYNVQSYTYIMQDSVMSNNEVFVKLYDESSIPCEVSYSTDSLAVKYLIYDYQEDNTFEIPNDIRESLSYSEALNTFNDALRDAVSIVHSESNEAQMAAIKGEEVLE